LRLVKIISVPLTGHGILITETLLTLEVTSKPEKGRISINALLRVLKQSVFIIEKQLNTAPSPRLKSHGVNRTETT
jgi:hypothetical protein